MPADNPPRRITIIKAPFDYYFPDRSAVMCFRETGEFMVKAEIADYAVTHGYAIESGETGSKARTTKGKSQRRRKTAIAKPDAGTVTGQDAGMGGTDLAADDSASAGQPLADSAD